MTLQEMLDSIKGSAEEIGENVLAPDEDWKPTVFVLKDNQVAVSHFPIEEGDGWREFFFTRHLPNAIKTVYPNPEAVAVLVTSWMAQVEPEEFESGDFVRPSQREDRVECLILCGVSADEEISCVAEIARSDGPPQLEWKEEFNDLGGRVIAGLRRAVWD